MDTPLDIARDEGVATWTLNDPGTRNALSGADMVQSIESAVEQTNADETVRVVILTASGSVFSSGGNIKDMRDRVGMFGGDPAGIRKGYRRGIQRIPLALARLDVPIIAAVNGPAVGAGCDLSLMCDVRVASSNASFAESFVRLGIIPGDGGTWFLPRLIGPARAAEMALTGASVDARTALEWGLVSRVVDPAELLPTALELAAAIAANPRDAVCMTKQLLRESEGRTLASLLDLSASLQAIAHHSDEHRLALEAALGGR